MASPYYPALQQYANGAVAPVETPEVQAEKAAHFAAHAKLGGPSWQYAAAGWTGHGPAGLPVDEPAVAHAKAAHFAAVAAAKAKIAHAAPAVHAEAYHHGPVYHGPYHIPTIVNGNFRPISLKKTRSIRF